MPVALNSQNCGNWIASFKNSTCWGETQSTPTWECAEFCPPPEYPISHPLACFPGGSEVKASASNAGDPGSIPGSGRSPAERNGNPLQCSCLENPMDGEGYSLRGRRVGHDWTPSLYTILPAPRNKHLPGPSFNDFSLISWSDLTTHVQTSICLSCSFQNALRCFTSATFTLISSAGKLSPILHI